MLGLELGWFSSRVDPCCARGQQKSGHWYIFFISRMDGEIAFPAQLVLNDRKVLNALNSRGALRAFMALKALNRIRARKA